ncbi:MAG: energy-coupling factor transporter transmembrane protein EcfT [Treponema sp.]|nr:energy-coupling factor transporter transmembrane protein EcfT [Treponema sp.]
MPWRLIIFIVIFAVFLVFITFNLENRCDISFGSKQLTIEQVPVFFTIFASFVLGLFSSIPLLLHVRKKYKDGNRNDKKEDMIKEKNDEEDEPHNVAADEKIKEDAAKAKKRFFAKRNGGK